MINKSVSSPATIADVSKSVKTTEKVLRAEILRVEERLEGVEEKLSGKFDDVEGRLSSKIDGIEVKLDRIASQLDGFVGRVDDLTNDNEIGAEQIHELRDTVKDHSKRITKLEVSN